MGLNTNTLDIIINNALHGDDAWRYSEDGGIETRLRSATGRGYLLGGKYIPCSDWTMDKENASRYRDIVQYIAERYNLDTIMERDAMEIETRMSERRTREAEGLAQWLRTLIPMDLAYAEVQFDEESPYEVGSVEEEQYMVYDIIKNATLIETLTPESDGYDDAFQALELPDFKWGTVLFCIYSDEIDTPMYLRIPVIPCV